MHCASKGPCVAFLNINIIVKLIVEFNLRLFTHANEAAVELIGGIHVSPVVLLLFVASISLCLLSSSTANADRSLAQFGLILT